MGALCSKDTSVEGIVVKRDTIALAPKISEDDLHHWHIWSQLDQLDETKQVQLAAFMHTCLDTIGIADEGPDADSAQAQALVETASEAIDVDGIQLHDVIHLRFPLSLDQVASMSQACAAPGPTYPTSHAFAEAADGIHIPLPASALLQLMTMCRDHYEGAPNIVDLTIPEGTTLTIVGDVHGQLHDVLHIFQEQGPPSATNWYLFNGDYRGNCSVEICAILFAYHALCPGSVHLNRGNHEDPHLNRLYSFQREVLAKYDRKMYAAFNDLFVHLPLAHTVQGQIFIVHGGLVSQELSLSDVGGHGVLALIRFIQAIPRREFQLYLPPTLSADVRSQLTTMRDLLWSDPVPPLGCQASRRGAGVLFGPDITARFLCQNGLKMLVRAHEPVREGFHWPYDAEQRVTGSVAAMTVPSVPTDAATIPPAMLVTIFSGSNYCYSNNKGAYMVLDAALAYTIRSFQVPTTYRITSSVPAFRSIEDHNRHNLMQLIGDNKKALLAAFEAKDPSRHGRVSMDSWVQVLSDVLQVELDWSRLAAVLLPPSSVDKEQVEYAAFLESYQTVYQAVSALAAGARKEVTKRGRINLDAFYMYRKELQAIFCFFDRDHSGFITLDEFQAGCALLNEHVATEQAQLRNISTLFQELDLQGTGKISVNAFLEAFRITNERELRKSASFTKEPIVRPLL
ncbi:calcineurin-like phosphoesterase [Achlya hypogyna]|uniref:Serine/threonine-protein phosphatase n=1 Tax=Achlya hypogyna TaxID=1202772 RepID=A0A1V9Y4W4_ACHHY|nr:calcineurin-like phosphoesterase [Achlya hypogyna]